MKLIRSILIPLCLAALGGCAASHKLTDKSIVYALPGTNTAVVGIALDKSGMPYELTGAIHVYPGQKVVYTGPGDFMIIFKERKTPNGIVENKSSKGVVVIEIPANLADPEKYPQFAEEFKKNGYVTFNYGIRAGDKEIDPPLKVYKPV